VFKLGSKDSIVTIYGKNIENIFTTQHLINQEISKMHGHRIKAVDIESQDLIIGSIKSHYGEKDTA